VSGAMTLEALLGTPVAFDQRIHAARPHPGQGVVAARLRALLEASDVAPAASDRPSRAAPPPPGRGVVAARLRALLEASDVAPARRTAPARVQDAYSLRCMPQVHGAVRGALRFAANTVEIETGSATDNPLVFAE